MDNARANLGLNCIISSKEIVWVAFKYAILIYLFIHDSRYLNCILTKHSDSRTISFLMKFCEKVWKVRSGHYFGKHVQAVMQNFNLAHISTIQIFGETSNKCRCDIVNASYVTMMTSSWLVRWQNTHKNYTARYFANPRLHAGKVVFKNDV